MSLAPRHRFRPAQNRLQIHSIAQALDPTTTPMMGTASIGKFTAFRDAPTHSPFTSLFPNPTSTFTPTGAAPAFAAPPAFGGQPAFCAAPAFGAPPAFGGPPAFGVAPAFGAAQAASLPSQQPPLPANIVYTRPQVEPIPQRIQEAFDNPQSHKRLRDSLAAAHTLGPPDSDTYKAEVERIYQKSMEILDRQNPWTRNARDATTLAWMLAMQVRNIHPSAFWHESTVKDNARFYLRWRVCRHPLLPLRSDVDHPRSRTLRVVLGPNMFEPSPCEDGIHS